MKSKNLIRIIMGILAVIVIALGVYFLSIDKKDPKTLTNKLNLSIIAPLGTPSLNLALLENSDEIKLDVEVVDGSDSLISSFTTGEKEMIIAPINLGLKMIEKKADYKLVSVVSWGNLYIVSDGTDSTDLAAFGEAALPGLILKHNAEKLPAYDITYYNSVSEVAALFKSAKVHNALIAEPLLTTILNDNKNYKVSYDMQKVYEDITELKNYPQAALFVRNDVLLSKRDEIMAFGDEITSIEASLKDNIDLMDQYLKDVKLEDYGLPKTQVLKKAYKNTGLNYQYVFNTLDQVSEGLNLFGIKLDSAHYIK